MFTVSKWNRHKLEFGRVEFHDTSQRTADFVNCVYCFLSSLFWFVLYSVVCEFRFLHPNNWNKNEPRWMCIICMFVTYSKGSLLIYYINLFLSWSFFFVCKRRRHGTKIDGNIEWLQWEMGKGKGDIWLSFFISICRHLTPHLLPTIYTMKNGAYSYSSTAIINIIVIIIIIITIIKSNVTFWSITFLHSLFHFVFFLHCLIAWLSMSWWWSSFDWITNVQYLRIIYLFFFFSILFRHSLTMEDMTWIVWIFIFRNLWSRNLIMLILNCVVFEFGMIWVLYHVFRTQWINQTLSNFHNKIHSIQRNALKWYWKKIR